ncbi:hypothetical protein CHS0354_014530 [Potamilus streckersoni]|uniref:OAR domain-containing protein n=1 Tax=Potamilus streckersoni TaxID=2493646 RepID=A0AAE0SA85_9BIVA|nr:hypothetical protein CHS0354_014530 [Potamilus streckersoni]
MPRQIPTNSPSVTSIAPLSTMSAFSNVPLSGMYFHGNLGVEWPQSFGGSLSTQMTSYFTGEDKGDDRRIKTTNTSFEGLHNSQETTFHEINGMEVRSSIAALRMRAREHSHHLGMQS